MTAGLCQAGTNDQSTAVFHQRMAEKRQLCLHARTLAIEFGVGIGCAGMRRVRTLGAAKVSIEIASARWWRRIVGAIDGFETLDRRPCLDQRAIDAEMLGRQKALDLRLRQQFGEEPCCDCPFEQPGAVLGERGVVPHWLVNPKADKPRKKKVEFEPLHQLALGSYRVERLQ